MHSFKVQSATPIKKTEIWVEAQFLSYFTYFLCLVYLLYCYFTQYSTKESGFLTGVTQCNAEILHKEIYVCFIAPQKI